MRGVVTFAVLAWLLVTGVGCVTLASTEVRSNTDGKMGHTDQLTEAERNDLVHYLESIGASRPSG